MVEIVFKDFNFMIDVAVFRGHVLNPNDPEVSDRLKEDGRDTIYCCDDGDTVRLVGVPLRFWRIAAKHLDFEVILSDSRLGSAGDGSDDLVADAAGSHGIVGSDSVKTVGDPCDEVSSEGIGRQMMSEIEALEVRLGPDNDCISIQTEMGLTPPEDRAVFEVDKPRIDIETLMPADATLSDADARFHAINDTITSWDWEVTGSRLSDRIAGLVGDCEVSSGSGGDTVKFKSCRKPVTNENSDVNIGTDRSVSCMARARFNLLGGWSKMVISTGAETVTALTQERFEIGTGSLSIETGVVADGSASIEQVELPSVVAQPAARNDKIDERPTTAVILGSDGNAAPIAGAVNAKIPFSAKENGIVTYISAISGDTDTVPMTDAVQGAIHETWGNDAFIRTSSGRISQQAEADLALGNANFGSDAIQVADLRIGRMNIVPCGLSDQTISARRNIGHRGRDGPITFALVSGVEDDRIVNCEGGSDKIGAIEWSTGIWPSRGMASLRSSITAWTIRRSATPRSRARRPGTFCSAHLTNHPCARRPLAPSRSNPLRSEKLSTENGQIRLLNCGSWTFLG